jgi:hypothetical protein
MNQSDELLPPSFHLEVGDFLGKMLNVLTSLVVL